jgi:hypothetical protein
MGDESNVRGYVVGPGRGVPHYVQDVKASGRSTGGSLTVMAISVDGGPPRHTHTREDESVYLFTGTLDVECGDDRFLLSRVHSCSCRVTCRTRSGRSAGWRPGC